LIFILSSNSLIKVENSGIEGQPIESSYDLKDASEDELEQLSKTNKIY